MSDTTGNDKPQFLSPVSSGDRLRQAREAAGLSRGEVAMQMRLSERKIQALEEDNYELFPSETFVSGYLRSYAKVLGLPESDFIRPVSSTQLPPVLTSSSGKNKQASSMDLPVRMVTYAIIVVMLVSLGMWWISQRDKVVVKFVDQAVVAQEQVGNAVVTVIEEQHAAPSVSEVNDGAADGAASATPLDNATDMLSNVDATAQQESTPPLVDPAAPPTVVLPKVKAETQTAVIAEEPEVPAPPPLTDDIPSSKLVIEYQSDSWTEVDDSAGRRLVYGLMPAGQTLELKGEAPFRVFLGYADGVIIHYNNELFEHTAYHRGEIARFRVGRTEHNQLSSR